MLIALTPFRYGKGSEHWNFAPNDPIKDGIIADGDISGLIAKKLIMNDATEMAAEGLNTSEIDNNKVSNSGYDHYLQSSIAIAKELISEENSIPKLLFAKSVEEKQSNPKRRKAICDAIKRRVYEITGKRIP